MPRKEDLIKQYLQETIQAVVPVYDESGNDTLVLTRKNEHRDSRSLPWLINRLAHYFNLDPAALRKRSAALLGQKHHLCLLLDPELVLLPLKVRQAAFQGETTIAYINMQEMEHYKESGDNPPYRTVLTFRGGRTIRTLNGIATVRERLRQGELLRDDSIRRRKSAVSVAGLDSRELLSILPGCSCFLKDLFTAVVTLADRKKVL